MVGWLAVVVVVTQVLVGVGMGFVQLTWRRNYEHAGKKLGVDFVANPKLLLKPEHAATILVLGMDEGWFTGKKLSDYITLQKSDFTGARRIVNGTDKAAEIARIARAYDADLKAEGYGVVWESPDDYARRRIEEDEAARAAAEPIPAPSEGNAYLRTLAKLLAAVIRILKKLGA